MRERVVGALRVGRAVARLAADTQVTFLAAAVAYYASFSLVPLALLAVAAATALGGEALANRLLDATTGVLTPDGRGLVLGAVTSPAGRSGATIVGALALGWGALKGFRGLDRAFSAVYGSPTADSMLDAVVDAAVVLVLLGVAVGAVFVVGAAAALLPIPAVGGLGAITLVVALAVVFLPFYRLFPDADVRLAEALPGAAFAAVGWTVLGVAFRLYAEIAAGYALYGLLGGLLLLLTWLYVGAIILVLGATVNAVLSGHDAGNRQVQQAGAPRSTPMSERPGGSDQAGEDPADGKVAALRADIEAYRADLEAFRADVEGRTVARAEVESDLRQYVRSRLRRGHARGWGPYLVLLYGTAMTLGAFYFLSGGWAILAMVVVWLSTLGLYVLMVITGAALGALSIPGRATDALKSLRSRR